MLLDHEFASSGGGRTVFQIVLPHSYGIKKTISQRQEHIVGGKEVIYVHCTDWNARMEAIKVVSIDKILYLIENNDKNDELRKPQIYIYI